MSDGIVSAQTHFSMVPNGVVGSDITDRAFRVYVSLRAYVRPDHDTFPKLSTVAKRFGMSESYLKRGISELRERGLLVIEKRHYSGGFRKVNSYYFPDVHDGKTGSDVTPPSRSDLTLPDGSEGGRPEGSDLLPPIEEEKQEEEKQEVTTSEIDIPDKNDRPDVEAIVDYFAQCLHENDVKFTVGKRWHDSARLLIDKDGYTLEQIKYIIQFATTDDFWKSNILSIPTLRDKFERLKLKATSQRTTKPTASQKMQSTIDRGRALQEQQLAIGNR